MMSVSLNDSVRQSVEQCQSVTSDAHGTACRAHAWTVVVLVVRPQSGDLRRDLSNFVSRVCSGVLGCDPCTVKRKRDLRVMGYTTDNSQGTYQISLLQKVFLGPACYHTVTNAELGTLHHARTTLEHDPAVPHSVPPQNHAITRLTRAARRTRTRATTIAIPFPTRAGAHRSQDMA